MEPVFERLKQALAARAPAPPEPIPQAVRQALRPAAVLVPLFLPAGEVQLLFTERSPDLKHHAGQISFPGGSVSPEDPGVQAAALREASEEVGLRPEDVDVLGQLDPSPVITLFEITPVIARVPPAYPFRPCPAEVARLIVLPLKLFLDPRALEVREREVFGARHRVLYYRVAGEEIWGATARVIEQLLGVVKSVL